MDDIELKNVENQFPTLRISEYESDTHIDKIATDLGTMIVAIQGDRNKPTIFTYHDIGLNHITNFQSFFNYGDTSVLIRSFCIYHINAPGQEGNAPNLPAGYIYPTMDQLAEMLTVVMQYYGLKHFIGFGVGAGANILARYALQHPHCVDGLFLINCMSTSASWTEWGYQKFNAMRLRNFGMTTSAQNYLLWHHFGKLTEERNSDLIQLFKYFFNKSINSYNLSMFIDSFIKRTDLQITRETDPEKKKTIKNFSCAVLLLTGNISPHVEETITMNSRLDPTNSTWMKLSDCGMPLEEQPSKVCEALHLFLQGLGYVASLSVPCARNQEQEEI